MYMLRRAHRGRTTATSGDSRYLHLLAFIYSTALPSGCWQTTLLTIGHHCWPKLPVISAPHDVQIGAFPHDFSPKVTTTHHCASI